MPQNQYRTLKNQATMLGADTVNPYESTQRFIDPEGREIVLGPNMLRTMPIETARGGVAFVNSATKLRVKSNVDQDNNAVNADHR